MYCSKCGAQIDDKAVICVKCGSSVRIAFPDNDSAQRWIVPIGRSGWAIAAGYLGLLSPFFCFPPVCVLALILGVLALVFGIIALCDIKEHPDKSGAGRAWFGIIAGGLAVIGCVIIWVY